MVGVASCSIDEPHLFKGSFLIKIKRVTEILPELIAAACTINVPEHIKIKSDLQSSFKSDIAVAGTQYSQTVNVSG